MPPPGTTIPFSDSAGQMVRDIIGDATYLYLVSCGKTGSLKTPTDSEVTACRPNFAAQILEIRPKWMLLMGSSSLAVFHPDLNVSTARGKPFELTIGKEKSVVCMTTVSPLMAQSGGMADHLREDISRFKEMVDAENWKTFVSDTCMGCGAWAERWTDEGIALCRDHWTSNPFVPDSLRGWVRKQNPTEETQLSFDV
jgi:uracil-DNA glycosylase family 4